MGPCSDDVSIYMWYISPVLSSGILQLMKFPIMCTHRKQRCVGLFSAWTSPRIRSQGGYFGLESRFFCPNWEYCDCNTRLCFGHSSLQCYHLLVATRKAQPLTPLSQNLPVTPSSTLNRKYHMKSERFFPAEAGNNRGSQWPLWLSVVMGTRGQLGQGGKMHHRHKSWAVPSPSHLPRTEMTHNRLISVSQTTAKP